MTDADSKKEILIREKEFLLFEETINRELRKVHYRLAGKKATETDNFYTSGCKGYGMHEVLTEILSDSRKERLIGEIVDKGLVENLQSYST